MKILYKTIRVSRFLQELHGRQARIIDLIVTYLSAVIGTIVSVYLAQEIALTVFKSVLLALVAFDISGGVVANFTAGTQNYYWENPKRRYKFILLHLLHPVLLIWIFTDDLFYIFFISGFTLLAIALINRIKNSSTQKLTASFFSFIGVTLSFVISVNDAVLQLLIILFIIKLIIAFSVKWN